MKISIITASYNCENTIKDTIESVLNQTHQDWELIIVDDGSKDNSVDIIKSYCEKDEKIKLYTHKNHKNKGLIKTLQFAISKASCDWIHFVECDDILKPDAIEKKIKVIEEYPNVELVFSEVEMFGDREVFKQYDKYMHSRKNLLDGEKFPTKIMQKNYKTNVIPTFSCVMCKKENLLNCYYNSPIDAYIDWFLWSQMANKEMYYIQESLTLWRISRNSYAQIFKERYDRSCREKYLLAIKLNIKMKSQSVKQIKLFLYDIKQILQNIFSVKNTGEHKVITILGIKLKIKRKARDAK